MEGTVTNNEQEQQFEYREGDEKATLVYRFYKKNIAFMHTTVPDALSGKGVGGQLAAYAFSYAKKLNKKVMVYCPFVGNYLKKHPELNEQLDKTYLGGR